MTRPILTADAMRAAEQSAIDAGASVEQLMERAGAALAEAAYRFAGPLPALMLCGPGNNGGDGYVAARVLAERGVEVRVAALAEPKSDAAKWARSRWSGEVEELADKTEGAPLVIDALFGTGLKRGLDEASARQLHKLCDRAVAKVACDLPSGVETDSGAELGVVRAFDLTVTFGALKPAHRLYPAMRSCGRVVLADIGIQVDTQWLEIGPPVLPLLDPGGHKYDRGLVHALAGKMPGAIALSAKAAARAGAGYVRVSTSRIIDGIPSSVVQTETATVDDERIGCLLVGPGMGDVPQLLTLALTSKAPKVLDADAIAHLGDPGRLKVQDAIITPHEGEFRKLFGEVAGSKPERALEAARRSEAVVVYKGPDTLIAAPDGRLGFAPPAPAWLASAGTGDVLAGIVAAMRARGLPAFEAACAGVWLQGRAAEFAGPEMIADDLADAVPKAIAEL
ncbi:MAG TPA: NAD(P)H-hydrate dehydratase [Sphingomicrobium sp.]